MHQFFEFTYEQVHQDQTQIVYESKNNPFFNDYNPSWGVQSNFSWNPHPMGTLTTQGSTFVEASYYDLPYSQYQPSPTIYSPSFEEKVLQVLDKIKSTN